jgi:hypothetical protein
LLEIMLEISKFVVVVSESYVFSLHQAFYSINSNDFIDANTFLH